MSERHHLYFTLATYLVCAIAFIGDITSIYFILNIWAFRKHKFIRCRIPPLTRNVLWIFFSLLLLCIINALVNNRFHFWKLTYFFIINDAIQYGCTFAYATRAWILFYHVEWSYESVNHIWRTQLSEVEKALDRSNTVDKEYIHSEIEENKLIQQSKFYITYRNTLGNYKKVFPLMMIVLLPLFIFLLDILPLIILGFDAPYTDIHNILFRTVHIFCFLVIILINFNLIHRISQISDKYGIGEELKRINICFAFFILLGRICEILIIITSSNMHYVEFIASICSLLSILFALYIGSYFVLRKLFTRFLTQNTLKKMNQNNHLYDIVTMCKNVQLEKERTQSKMDANRLTLNEVLSSKVGFETFTQFLISELSVENMLFLVEVKQYKACCRRYHKKEHGLTTPITDPNENNTLRSITITTTPTTSSNLPTLRSTTTTKSKPNVFKSHSVMKVDYIPKNNLLQSLDPYDYSLYLFHKYVDHECDLQINIPHKIRRTLTDFMAKNKLDIELMDDYTDQMFQLYDKAWDQIHTLIKSDSFLRFKNTKEYQDVCLQSEKEKEEEKKQQHPLVLKQVPSILEWKYPEADDVDTLAPSGPRHAAIESATIPELQEIDDEFDAEMNKLNSITHYDTERTAQIKKQLSDDIFAIDEDIATVLEDIDDYDDYGDDD